ncbi:unnamed protein product [Trichogramma brassicae]|uniref:CCHC-type domain-containing protein n=1 Tax=Trichogramma brassicae TaxID=86971 RepID=A0A6H5IKJ6_9HYME|nr:unnamed protein product [Trichogramma brassicae]
MELLARISNYVKSRNQGHSGYNGQAAYNQDNRGYEAPTQPSSDLSLVRQDAHTEYSTGRVPYTPSSFRLFNDIVKQIPKFDGTPDILKLFCTAVEEAVEQLPFFEQRIVRALQSKLVGDARYIVGKLTGYQCAQELLRDLQDRFVNRNVADGLAMQLGSAKQKAGEDVRKFGVTIRSLYDNAIAAYEQAPDLHAFERESAIYSLQSSVVDCFLYGLLEPLKMEVRIKNPKTLAEAIEVAGETERKLRYRSVTGSNITSVGLIGVPLCTEQSGNTNASDDKRVVCQICEKPGHSGRDCNIVKRALLQCSICNRRGHEASTCNSANDGSRNASSDSNQQRDNNNTSGNNTSNNNNNRNNVNSNNASLSNASEPPTTQRND